GAVHGERPVEGQDGQVPVRVGQQGHRAQDRRRRGLQEPERRHGSGDRGEREQGVPAGVTVQPDGLRARVRNTNYAVATLLLGAALVAAAASESAKPVAIDANSFRCIRDLHAVRGFYVDSLTGDLAGTLAAANAPNGAVYPPGSVVQLIPGEVMVKR